ncbi:MAG: MBL fold metallo-hydrolase [Candidatus Goldbacteria bacterium]|nr:MBL fold metallo-hydrolase [Candidatus Goldiibacteriota bacterium]
MEIIHFTTEDFGENTYFLINNGELVIIDPGINAELLKSEISKRNLKIKYVLLTHGHYDHILSAPYLNAVLCAHEDEKILIEDAELNLSVYATNKKIILKNVKYFSGENYEIENFEIFHTPGHTAGSVIIKTGNNLFTGDTLFYDTVGRTDLPTGDAVKLRESLKIFKNFDKKTVCYPGHGNSFLLSDAFRYNYFLSRT